MELNYHIRLEQIHQITGNAHITTTAYASVPPNIWRSSVMECAGKYEVFKNV